MEYAWITYTSITFAERLKRECRQKMKSCSVRQTPAAISQAGCSYGIRCYQKDLPFLLDLSRQMKLKIRGVYLEQTTDTGEVVYKEYDISG